MKMKKLVSLFVISFITISLFSQNKIPLIYVGSGIFQMGSNNGQNNEKPVHTVSLSSFYIGKTEVTQAQWKAVMKNNPSDSKGDNHPVENVSWYDAIAFCNKLSMIEGRTPVYSIDGITDPDKWNLSSNLNGIIAKYESANGYRLPTEAEWEYAARGGVKSKNYRFSGSDNSGSVAWYDANSSYQVHDVSTKSANELGICDMTGNVYEWCWDGYTSNYNNKSETNPTGPTYSTYKVARGGSFVDNFDYCRVSFRTAIQSSEKRNNLGFRVACSSEETIGYFRHQKDIEDQKLKLQEKKLQVWSFTDEIEGFLNAEGYGYKTTHPNVEIEYKFTPTDQFPSKLDPVLASGRGAPDVFALEDAFVRKYVESGLLLPLDDLYEEVKNKMADYPIRVGSYNGHVYAMSWQVAPGAMFYRRSYAKKYWGSDDPADVQEKVKDLNTFMATARELNRISRGKCKLVSTSGDLFLPYKGARKKPWIVDDKLYIDPAMDAYMEMAKIFYDEELDGRTSQWAEGWYAGMNDRLIDEKGNDLEIMAYFLPTWGLHYVLKQDASKTSGDWAMCAGPAPYRWGGTWIAAYKGTKKPEAAKEMIRYLATDDKFLEAMAKATGDVVGNYNVQKKIKGYFSEPYLGGQNHYEVFCELSKCVDGSLTQGTDQQIEALWSEAVTAYAMGEKTKRVALYDFKQQVATKIGY